MSLTLGEKLRQAREERNISIREVADQTRISASYLECIENNDYRTLPGGIFNKGFVKSFAKYVGLDQQEALQDYASLVANQNINVDEELKTYRPEVLTGNRGNSSMLATIFFVVIILSLGTAGILFLLKYLSESQNQLFSNSSANSNTNGTNSINNFGSNELNASTLTAPSLGETKIEFKALKNPVSVVSNSDGKRASYLITPEKPFFFEPKQNLTLSYSKSQAQNVQLTINGKQINLPPTSANSLRRAIELEITNDNLRQIWESGAIKLNTDGNINSASRLQ
jgi:cytoskeletal protein RodZ